MTRLVWDDPTSRPYEFGVDRGVFYPKGGIGYAWSGLVSVNETTVDAGQSMIFIDGVGNQQQLLLGSFAATIEAITYPKEFEPYDGFDGFVMGQLRPAFDFCYRTMQESGHYKIHLVYNAKVVPTQKNRSSINGASEIALFSWELSTLPEAIPEARASSHFILDSKYVWPDVMAIMVDRLYGNDASQPDMPTVTELLTIFDENAVFRVIDNGDGTCTIIGPDDWVHDVGTDQAYISSPSVILLDEPYIRASSY